MNWTLALLAVAPFWRLRQFLAAKIAQLRRERALAALRQLARRLKLTPKSTPPGADYVEAEVEGFSVQLRMSGQRALISISDPQRLPAELEIGPSRTAETSWNPLGEGAFAAPVHIVPTARLVAACDHATRLSLVDLVRAGVTVHDGVLSYKEPWGLEDRWLVKNLNDALVLARRLGMPSDRIPDALAENFLNDANFDVGSANLALLVNHFPNTAAARRAGEAAVKSDSYRVRFLGATALVKEHAFSALKAIIEDARAPESVQADALEHIGGRFSAESAMPLLDRALESSSEALKCAAIRGIAAGKFVEFLDRLHSTAGGASAGVAREVASALGRLEDPRSEPTLLMMLDVQLDAEVHREVALALGKLGTIASVEKLLGLVQRSGAADVRHAARGAVRSIQGRLGPTEAGQLSVVAAPADVGALSITAGEGDLSFADSASVSANGAVSLVDAAAAGALSQTGAADGEQEAAAADSPAAASARVAS